MNSCDQNIVDMVKTNKIDKAAEDRCIKDHIMYRMGYTGYPDKAPPGLSQRDLECYNMGYRYAEWEKTHT